MAKVKSLSVFCLLPVTAVFGAVEDYAKPDINVSVMGSQELVVTEDEVQVDVAPGASANFLGVEKDVSVRVQEGGSANIKVSSEAETSWHSKVGLWLDASEEWTLEQEINKSGKGSVFTENGVTSALIVRWRDRRREQTEWLGYNDRGAKMTTGTYPGVMPYVVSNGCNGLSYVTMGNQGLYGRRMPFIKVIDGVEMSPGTGGANEAYTLVVKYVMMVFGSQRGGGMAVVSGMERADTTGTVTAQTGIFASKYDTRLDGATVDPTVAGLNGGWQVLSFTPSSDNVVRGLGWGKWNTNVFGGQNYAEVLIFTNAPTLYEIRSAELYLSKKWGVKTYAVNESGEVRLYGNGSATVAAGTVRVGGMFGGTLSVAEDAELVLTDEQPVPTAPASGMSGWYDPNREDMREIVGDAVARVNTLKNIAGLHNGKAYELKAFSRQPAIVSEVRGWGSSMDWCDYSTNKTGGTGNTLRFDTSDDGVEYSMPVRTGFMMLDTRAGGGTPFLDTAINSFSASITSQYVQARVVSSPIFRVKNNSSFVTNSPTYLNGVQVDSGKHPYNSRPELLSFSFTQEMPIRCIGAWQQSLAYTVDPDYELRHGEIIFYPAVLSESDRKDTEAYLMAKWIGVTPSGYGNPGLMTITGAGNVKTANGRMRPKIDAGFTGRMEIPEATLSFSIDATSDSPVADAISMPNGELSTPEAITVDLSFPTRPETGKYTLVSAKEWNAAAVSIGDVSGPRGICTANYKIEREGNTLVLTVWRPGMRIIIQ